MHATWITVYFERRMHQNTEGCDCAKVAPSVNVLRIFHGIFAVAARSAPPPRAASKTRTNLRLRPLDVADVLIQRAFELGGEAEAVLRRD
jgi:hypothetical protein